MFNLKTKYLWRGFLFFLISVAVVFVSGGTVKADDTPTGLSNDDVLGYTPNGSIIGRPAKDGIFTKPSSLINGGTNAAAVVNNTLSNTVYMTFWSSKNNNGILWSNEKNKMDVTKNAYFSFWIKTPVDTTSGGGLAFVMQNDPNGTNALSTLNGNATAPMETLGVWAADQNTSHLSNAIQNSWALEFDNYPNTSGTVNNAFDKDSSLDSTQLSSDKIHIASGYPADEQSYLPLSNGAYSLIHQSPIYRTIGTNSGWHHVSILYNPNSDGKTANVTYKFNDKNIDGTPNTNTGVDSATNPVEADKTVEIDLSKFNLGSDKKITWGFVGASNTGASESQLIYEQLSSLADVSVDAKIFDSTQNDRELTSNYKEINAGDNLKLQYDLKYNGGQEDVGKIKTTIDVPKNVTLNYGASIKFANGNTENISNSEIDTANKTGVLTHTISLVTNVLNTTNNQATLTLTGTTPTTVADNTKVASSHAHFASDTYIGDAMATDFVIRNPKIKTLNLDASLSSTEISTITSTNLKGSLTYADGSAFESEGALLNVTVDGKSLSQMAVTATDDNKKIDFSLPFYGSSDAGTDLPEQEILGPGTHTITISANDHYNNKSETKTFTVTVDAQSLKLDLGDGDFSFANIQSYYSGDVRRNNDWQVNVIAQDSPWSLSASATSLVNDKNESFDGEMFYRDEQGEVADLESPTLISSSEIKKSETGTFDVTKDWSKNTGILLHSDGDLVSSGKYTGTINWTLNNSI